MSLLSRRSGVPTVTHGPRDDPFDPAEIPISAAHDEDTTDRPHITPTARPPAEELS